MKKRVDIVIAVILVVSLIFLLSLSLVSASWFSDFWGKITGSAVSISSINIKKCVDSDGGNNPLVKGMTSTKDMEYNDYCFNGYKKLKEYYCDSRNNLKVKSYKCKDGCKDGACLKSACYNDSDCPSQTIRYCVNSSACFNTTFYTCANPGTINAKCVVGDSQPSPACGGCPNGCLNGACINQICVNECGNGKCQEIVCLEVGCPCEETAESCPQDC